ncbi:amidase [Belnapia rosea]|uniref:Aspartyl-tRNA(Asn)/glutamyl-tRNA(Gln) amidotransferase subunit A n=1 Tax=Belnapia rosea TaxID=938405 RepID=A0A1G6ZEH2_9PROT|nr:amidase [Belnapia rosea]SDE00587.1 aspartyl-tRNA(Asn)/glutamyl-tRNA(Gln) amidotransferase subunit A [Belnapia rosea]
MTDEPCFLTIAEAARRIARRALSPVELTEAYLARIAAHDGVLRSYIRATPEAALAAARQAEAEIMQGGPRGPLHGIPFALKDIFDSAGLPTTGHSARCVGNIAAEDAEATARLKAAGAVPLGKLATHEFATGGPSWDLPFPPARNPWDLTRFPGGSSSGSGVAVAAGLAPGAMGSDTGGSIRLPAAFCGTAGLKPSYGRVSKRGVLPLSYTLDNAGPLAWTVEDCAILLQAIAGHDPRDPASADLPVPDYRADLHAGIKGMRIGLVRHWYEADRRASDPTITAMDAAVEVLRSLGAEVREVTLHPLAAYQATMRVTGAAESFAIHADWLRSQPGDYGEVFRYRILPGALITGPDYVQAQRFQRLLAAEMRAALGEVDALLTATTWGEAPVMTEMRAEANFAAPPLTNPWNVAQLPCLALCCGFGPGGLPLSLQFATRPFAEALLLRIGQAYEAATPWRARRPVIPAEAPPEYPVSQAAPPPEADWAATIAALAGHAAIAPDAAQFAQLAEAMPHLDAMIAALPRSLPFGAEPANSTFLE